MEKIEKVKKLLREMEWLEGGRLCGGAKGCYICGNLQSEGHKENCRLAKILKLCA